MGLTAVRRMSNRSLLTQRNRLQNKLGSFLGDYSGSKDDKRLRAICREIGKRVGNEG